MQKMKEAMAMANAHATIGSNNAVVIRGEDWKTLREHYIANFDLEESLACGSPEFKKEET